MRECDIVTGVYGGNIVRIDEPKNGKIIQIDGDYFEIIIVGYANETFLIMLEEIYIDEVSVR